MCPVEKATTGWSGLQCVRVLVDSGAADNVVPPGLISEYKVTEGEQKRAGVKYVTADGTRIPNMGEQNVRVALEDGTLCSLEFQVAKVNKPILSVGKLIEKGHSVTFNDVGGEIVHLKSGIRTQFKRVAGVYMLDMWVLPAGFRRQGR